MWAYISLIFGIEFCDADVIFVDDVADDIHVLTLL